MISCKVVIDEQTKEKIIAHIEGQINPKAVKEKRTKLIDNGEKLKQAVNNKGIISFMEKMAKGESVLGVDKNVFDEAWKTAIIGRKPAREWVKSKFRTAVAGGGGKHEWIPSNLIPEVIDRASTTKDLTSEGLQWIKLQNELRSPTEQIIYNPDKGHKKASFTTAKGDTEDRIVLQGHVGSVYLEEIKSQKQQIKYSEDFHSKLRTKFRSNTPIVKCIEELGNVFSEWVWKGDSLSIDQVHPELICYKLKAKDKWSEIKDKQKKNYTTINKYFSAMKNRYDK
jgi:hypothetical protein